MTWNSFHSWYDGKQFPFMVWRETISYHTGFFHCYNYSSLGMGNIFPSNRLFFLTLKGKLLTCIWRKYSGKLRHISNFSWFLEFISGLRPSIKPSNQEKILNMFLLLWYNSEREYNKTLPWFNYIRINCIKFDW